ncbi:MAG: glycosyltransferase, partial [Actinomycetota bacterium]
SSAVLAGMTVARGDVLVVIDADLQHDERCIPDLVRAISDGADVALGSREVEGGGYGTFGRRRLAISRVGAAMARWAIGVEVADPMSGFFAVSRPRYESLSGGLNPRGFKILLEFLARGPEPEVAEIGYLFRQRTGGATKFDTSVSLAFMISVVELSIARRLGRRRTAA